jgi:hypothetical protein
VIVNAQTSHSGTYSVTITDVNGCTNSANVTIMVNSLPTITAIASPSTICSGYSSTLTASGASTYSWSTAESGSSITVMPTSTSTYTVTGTDANGCSNTTSVIVTVNPDNTISLTSASGTDSQTVCVNTPIIDITYSSTGATGATFSNLPSGIIGTYLNGNITISGIPTDTGIFNYTVTLTGGCGNVTASGIISVNDCSNIEELSTNASWNLFPNPNNGTFTLQTEHGGVFELMDICGKVIQTYNVINTSEQIQVNLPSGMYFIRKRESGITQKLIIQ